MSQAALVTPAGTGIAVRGNLNNAIARLASRASGTSRPVDIATYEEWVETDNPGGGIVSVWRWDGASDVLVALLNASTHVEVPAGAIASTLMTTKGDIIKGGVAGAAARLGVGAAFSKLSVNSAGDDVEYQLAGWERIASDIVPAGSSTVDFTGIPANCKKLALEFDVMPATNAVEMLLRVSVAGAFDSGSNYVHTYVGVNSAGGFSGASGAETGLRLPTPTAGIKNDATVGGISGRVIVENPQAARYTRMNGQVLNDDNTGITFQLCLLHGAHLATGPIDGLRLVMSSGNVASGRVSLLALRA